MKFRSALLCLLLLTGPVFASCAGNNPPPTAVASVADVGTKIEQSGTVILHAAETANAAVVPSTGKPLITRQQLDDVAIGVNKLGHLGLALKYSLDDYNVVKAAGGDLTVVRAGVLKAVNDLTAAMNVITKALPAGTLKTVDDAVTDIFGFIADVKASAGL
jgi:hypothetical protein